MAADGLDAVLHTNGTACFATGCVAGGSDRVADWRVEIMYTSNHAMYDRLVLRNVVVIDLLAASANNAVLEAISMNNPVFISRLPAVVEYLGEGYPLYFDSAAALEAITPMT